MAEKSNNENWARQIEGWKASGESQRAYCEKSGLALSTFGRWWRKLGREAESIERRPFVEIPAPVNEKHVRKAEGASGLVIRLPEGVEVQVEERTDPELLRRVLRILGTPR